MTLIFIDDKTKEELYRYLDAQHIPADGEFVELIFWNDGKEHEFSGIVVSRQWKYLRYGLHAVRVHLRTPAC